MRNNTHSEKTFNCPHYWTLRLKTLRQNNSLTKLWDYSKPSKTLLKRNNNLDRECSITIAKELKNTKIGYVNALLNSVKAI